MVAAVAADCGQLISVPPLVMVVIVGVYMSVRRKE